MADPSTPDLPNPPRRKVGRPRKLDPGATISTWLPASDYDKVFQLARQRDESLSACVRRIVRQRVTPPKG